MNNNIINNFYSNSDHNIQPFVNYQKKSRKFENIENRIENVSNQQFQNTSISSYVENNGNNQQAKKIKSIADSETPFTISEINTTITNNESPQNLFQETPSDSFLESFANELMGVQSSIVETTYYDPLFETYPLDVEENVDFSFLGRDFSSSDNTQTNSPDELSEMSDKEGTSTGNSIVSNEEDEFAKLEAELTKVFDEEFFPNAASGDTTISAPSTLTDEERIQLQTETIFNRYHLLTEEQFKNQIGFSRDYMRKVIKIALTVNLENGHALIDVGPTRILVQRDSQNFLTGLYDISNQSQLGKGSFGRVFTIRDLILGGEFAFKAARLDYSSEIRYSLIQREEMSQMSQEEVQRGFDILTTLNQKGPQRGIPPRPHIYVDIRGLNGYGMNIGIPLSKFSYNSRFEKSEKLFKSLFQDLAEGVKFLMSEDFIHNDIKLANIILYEKEGKWVAAHSDLDSGLFMNEISYARTSGAFTYFPKKDQELLQIASAKYPLNKEEIKDINRMQMTYCLGKAMFDCATLWSIDLKRYPIIEQMMDLDPYKRPSIEQILA